MSLVSSKFLCREMIRMVFSCMFVHLFALLCCPSDCELRFTINWISEKSIVNNFEMFTLRVNSFAASLPRIPNYMVLSLFFSCAVSNTTESSSLDHVVWEWRVHLVLVKLSSGFAVNQAVSTSAVDNSLIPIKKTVRPLYFWCSFAQLE